MLANLRELNTVVGKITPAEMYAMTPKEREAMVLGGQQRSLDQLRRDFIVQSQTTVQSIFAKDNRSNEELQKSIQKQQATLNHADDPKYLAEQRAKKERQKHFNKFFGAFSRRKKEGNRWQK